MSGISEILSFVYGVISGLSLDLSLYIAWGAYAAIFSLALILTLCNDGMRRADKRAFLSFTNAFTAVTFALMYTEKPLTLSVLTAVVFWCIGYMLYGLLAALTNKKLIKRQMPSAAAAAATAPPDFVPQMPAIKENVRLDHALSVTDKLLAAELGRGDRAEVERIKTLLNLLQAKPSLTAEENSRLNDNFNTLLKLMAKYNV